MGLVSPVSSAVPKTAPEAWGAEADGGGDLRFGGLGWACQDRP